MIAIFAKFQAQNADICGFFCQKARLKEMQITTSAATDLKLSPRLLLQLNREFLTTNCAEMSWLKYVKCGGLTLLFEKLFMS